jgi:hypothetical protein
MLANLQQWLEEEIKFSFFTLTNFTSRVPAGHFFDIRWAGTHLTKNYVLMKKHSIGGKQYLDYL